MIKTRNVEELDKLFGIDNLKNRDHIHELKKIIKTKKDTCKYKKYCYLLNDLKHNYGEYFFALLEMNIEYYNNFPQYKNDFYPYKSLLDYVDIKYTPFKEIINRIIVSKKEGLEN